MTRLLATVALALAAHSVQAADLAQVQPVLARNGCTGCHAPDAKLAGPSWHDIANRYINRPDSRSTLADKIRKGSENTWGAEAMPPNPQVDDLDMKTMVEWLATGASAIPAAAAGS